MKSKTECWTKKSAKSVNRDKSAKRSARNQTKKKPVKKQEEKPKIRHKTFNNVKSRIDTGIRKAQKNFGSNNSRDSFEFPNQYNLGGYANEGESSFVAQKMNYRNNINFPPAIDVKRYQLNQQEPEMKNNPNLQYEVFSSEEEVAHLQDMDDFDSSEMHNHFVENQNIENQEENFNFEPQIEQYEPPKNIRKYFKSS